MKKIFYGLLIAIGISFNVMAIEFIEGLEDVPVMPGLDQIESDSVSFGNAESRFVEAYLSSAKHKFADVEKFYINTLPQLGWMFEGKRQNTLYFYRDGEAVEIAVEKKTPLTLRITLKSRD